eukprot:TRINITY_DN3961_c0_g2_i1.p1 TRINITY_DN3961_c0_g2~~TRINITY_DN3961_c0_g2_i1.p1  ORF type:complete len:374 (+),score=76.61 TRINITY_DN3961_c0_g2_i1:226-1347(+)
MTELRIHRGTLRILFTSFLCMLLTYICQGIVQHQSWGMKVILHIQSQLRSADAVGTKWLDMFMFCCSLCGFEFVFVIVPLALWWGNRKFQKLGLNLFFLLSYSLLISSILKTSFREPRPLWIERSIHREEEILEFSFPSGHAWATTITWLMIMRHFGNENRATKAAVQALGSVIILLTCFSRVYFGVHYPHDVAAGIAFAALCYIFRRYFVPYDDEAGRVPHVIKEASPVEDEKNNHPKMKDNAYTQGLVWFLMCVLIVAVFEENHKKEQMGLYFTLGTILTGIILRPSVCFLEDKGAARRVTRVVLGLVPVAILALSFRQIQKNVINSRAQSTEATMFSFGVLIAVWALFGSQMIFQKVGLGQIFPKGKKVL